MLPQRCLASSTMSIMQRSLGRKYRSKWQKELRTRSNGWFGLQIHRKYCNVDACANEGCEVMDLTYLTRMSSADGRSGSCLTNAESTARSGDTEVALSANISVACPSDRRHFQSLQNKVSLGSTRRCEQNRGTSQREKAQSEIKRYSSCLALLSPLPFPIVN